MLAIYNLRKRPQKTQNLLTPWSETYSFQNCKKMNFCCLSHQSVIFCYGSLGKVIKNSLLRPVEKAMAPHSSTLAWKIPWTEEPVRLQSMRSLRVRHDCETSLSLFTSLHWRRKWQPTPVFLPGESQGRGSLLGCRLWGRTESDMTEVTQHSIKT